MVALVYDHFQADEYNGEMFVAGRYTEKNGCNFFEVVGITRYGENELYYFIDCGNCDQDMYEDSSAIEEWMEDHENSGFSCGSFVDMDHLMVDFTDGISDGNYELMKYLLSHFGNELDYTEKSEDDLEEMATKLIELSGIETDEYTRDDVAAALGDIRYWAGKFENEEPYGWHELWRVLKGVTK